MGVQQHQRVSAGSHVFAAASRQCKCWSMAMMHMGCWHVASRPLLCCGRVWRWVTPSTGRSSRPCANQRPEARVRPWPCRPSAACRPCVWQPLAFGGNHVAMSHSRRSQYCEADIFYRFLRISLYLDPFFVSCGGAPHQGSCPGPWTPFFPISAKSAVHFSLEHDSVLKRE